MTTPPPISATITDGIRAVSLDLDDTLWAIGPVIERAERKLYDWLHEHYPRVADHTGRDTMHALRVAVMDEHPHRHHDYTFLRREMLLRLARAAGYQDEVADEAFAAFQSWRNELTPFDDVLPALEWLKDRYAVVALTNGNADLDVIGLGHLFDHVVTARAVGAAKPHPRMFEVALERLGLAAHEVLHVGDEPTDDIEGARSAGWRSVWMDRFGRSWPDGVAPADSRVRHLGELVDALEPGG